MHYILASLLDPDFRITRAHDCGHMTHLKQLPAVTKIQKNGKFLLFYSTWETVIVSKAIVYQSYKPLRVIYLALFEINVKSYVLLPQTMLTLYLFIKTINFQIYKWTHLIVLL